MKMVCWRKSVFLMIGSLLVGLQSGAKPLELAQNQDRLQLLDSSHWKIGEIEGRACLILYKTGEQRPPVRRPGEYALWKSNNPIGEFTIEAVTLEPESKINRDICLIFGYKDDCHFYYAHISSTSDNIFHNIIMRVEGSNRTRINLEKDPEPRLSNGWKTIRVRQMKNGQISVFVDDLEEPIMTAEDATYPIGIIGFGSFDDRAAFATLHTK